MSKRETIKMKLWAELVRTKGTPEYIERTMKEFDQAFPKPKSGVDQLLNNT